LTQEIKENFDLFMIANQLRKDIDLLPVWQKDLFIDEIERIKEREQILREICKYEYSRLFHYIDFSKMK
jgi:hypothetical protein